MFWSSHDPTSPAWSTQYKAVVWTHDDAQRAAAIASRDRIAAERGEKVCTEILPAGTFWRAEDYHQKYGLRDRDELAARVRGLYASEEEFVDSTLAARLNGLLSGYPVSADDPDLGDAERAILRSVRR